MQSESIPLHTAECYWNGHFSRARCILFPVLWFPILISHLLDQEFLGNQISNRKKANTNENRRRSCLYFPRNIRLVSLFFPNTYRYVYTCPWQQIIIYFLTLFYLHIVWTWICRKTSKNIFINLKKRKRKDYYNRFSKLIPILNMAVTFDVN